MFNFLSGTAKTYLIDAIEPYAIWCSVAAVGLLVVGGIIFAIAFKDRFARYLKLALSVLFVYSLILGLFLLTLEIIKHYDPSYLEKNYVNKEVTTHVLIPLAATLFITLCGAITLTVLGKTHSKNGGAWFKKVTVIVGAVVGASVIVTLILMFLYYLNHIVGDGYYTAEGAKFSSAALYVGATVLSVGAIAAAFIFDKNKTPFSAKVIARAGVCIALSFALSYVKIFSMPQGGSITLASMLPIMLFGFSYGPKKGLFVGFIYGMLQAVQTPYIIHPAQFLLDYPVAFTMLGFAGVFVRTKLPTQASFALGAIISGSLRYISHVISGVFAFGAYAIDAGETDFFLYSLLYNSFVFVDIAIAIAVGTILLTNKAFRKLVTE